jgi:hypothetical protein
MIANSAENEELLAVKRLKLDYEDLVLMSADLQRRWEEMLAAVGLPKTIQHSIQLLCGLLAFCKGLIF